MNIFAEILDTRSLTAIGYQIEDALPTANPAEQKALRSILETNKLDEAYAIEHEQLGQHEEAAKLRAWLARAPSKMDSGLAELLEL